MYYITRDLECALAEALRGKKIVILYGSRQTGKTTLIERLLAVDDIKREGVVTLSGDVLEERELLAYETMTPEKARVVIGEAKTLFVDEAQKIRDIGLTLKIIHDRLKDVRIVATGSSSFELSEEVGEPLTGRMDEYVLSTFSFPELARMTSPVSERNSLESRLLYGSYPDVVTAASDMKRRRALKSLCSADLFKDVLKWQNLKNSDMLGKLTKVLSLQIGNEVSYKEIGDLIGMDNETVESYIERLQKAFVVFRLSAFARNLRNELKKSKKIYFCDTGIRNAVIGNFLPLGVREDTGHLFENYLIAERMKNNRLKDLDVQSFFWRIKGSGTNEIDYLEESAERGLLAYEFKWSPGQATKARCPKAFAAAYPEASWHCVSRDNYIEFVTGGDLMVAG
ncbi:MAG: ATP-binding protein [Kiritimatiellae bacterium]|nr:ATP-binding protein [Kiritimatiellia bacterium]